MELWNRIHIKRGLFIILTGFSMAAVTTCLAAKSITIKTYVDKQTTKHTFIYAVGFSVNKKGHGSLGRSTTKSGPADALYAFGFKSGKGNISCGEHTLKNNSTVVLSYNGKTCSSTVYKTPQ